MEKEDDVRTYLADHGTKGIDLAIEKWIKPFAQFMSLLNLLWERADHRHRSCVCTDRTCLISILFAWFQKGCVHDSNDWTNFQFIFGLLKSFVQGHGAGGESFWSRWNCCHDRSSCFDGFCVYFTICCTSFDQPRCRQYFTVSGARWRPNLFLLIEKIRVKH